MQQFFYDAQIRRFLLQFTRIFSNFQVEYGRDDSGNPTLYRVPVRYGDASRQAQTILQNNSVNNMPATPIMTFYITGLEYARDRVQEPYHVNKMQVRQRTWDEATESYETTQGNAFSIERLMPVPYNLTINLDIWTSNTNQKLQLLEQILVLFNPSLEIQSTDNFIDWTSLSVVEMDRTSWSSRTIPVGTEDPIDISTMTFSLPIWISSPAKVKKLGVVEKIIMSIFDAQGDLDNAVLDSDLLLGTRQKITPFGYKIILLGNQVQCLPNNQVANTSNDSLTPVTSNTNSNLSWRTVVGQYGVIRAGISQLRVDNPRDGTEIVGTIAYHPTDDRFLLFTIDPDTLPANSLDPVSAIIDPTRSAPGIGLPAAATGQRYLLIDDIGSDVNQVPAVAWGPLVARANDIIEYDGTEWTVSFHASTVTTIEYMTNITTEVQYRWTGQQWLKSYQGLYPGGEWSLVF